MLNQHWFSPEQDRVRFLLESLPWDGARAARVNQTATDLMTRLRAAKQKMGDLDSFLRQFGLDTEEGMALMGLAEAILRIPDTATVDALIDDKIAVIDWLAKGHDGDKGGDWMTKAAGWGLNLTRSTLNSVVGKLGQPVIRQAVIQAIRMMGRQFVLGETIADAVRSGQGLAGKGYAFSYDMLGEGARTAHDAQRYFNAYQQAIVDIPAGNPRNGISVKLSALHPRYHVSHARACVPELTDMVLHLCAQAASRNLTLTIDAEETDRLEISLDILRAVRAHKTLSGWEGLGLAVQAYQKRAPDVIDTVLDCARANHSRLRVRLVKGAYWDSEMKRAQVLGLPDYPLYTRKTHTDLSYLACAHRMIQASDHLACLFGTHNAHTVAGIIDLAGARLPAIEFQRLHGMGDALFDALLATQPVKVSLYAPVGPHRDLLAYLVRRLLENGANTSFVARMRDPDVAIADLIRDPVAVVRAAVTPGQPGLTAPSDLFGGTRLSAAGIELADSENRIKITQAIDSVRKAGMSIPPADPDIDAVMDRAAAAFPAWSNTPAANRAACLEKAADLMEADTARLMGILVVEAGKTWGDALSEVREAVDFCRYYAAQGKALFADGGAAMPGYTGESNVLRLSGRGVWVCISPWNFPLAIFVGQVAAALMAGNTVIAKPAEQTPFIALEAVRLLVRAGVPDNVVQWVPGDGGTGARLVAHGATAGVAFTGSTDTAQSINRTLAARPGPIVPLIAETGGINAMMVDSTALLEQSVDDVVASAFGSAGQRCSALRIVCVQDDIADDFNAMLKGAMDLLTVGDPALYETDIGPVIDDDACAMLKNAIADLDKTARLVASARPPAVTTGRFITPVAYEIAAMADVKREIFGPVLHVLRYRAADREKIIQDINAMGYGLTFGAQTRIRKRMDDLSARIRAGNIYINRSMTGAVVGVQPFGGMGLSGTGPKAGGPHYLLRFATEIHVSNNITAIGGNISLLMGSD